MKNNLALGALKYWLEHELGEGEVTTEMRFVDKPANMCNRLERIKLRISDIIKFIKKPQLEVCAIFWKCGEEMMNCAVGLNACKTIEDIEEMSKMTAAKFKKYKMLKEMKKSQEQTKE